MCEPRRANPTALVVATLLILPALAVTPAAADYPVVCDLLLTHAGTLATGGEVQLAGENFFVDAIPASCGGAPFTARGEHPGDDIDVTYKDGSATLRSYASLAGEAGVIPVGTTTAEITFYSGAPGTISLRARMVDAPVRTGDVTLYLRSGPTGLGPVDMDLDGDVLSEAAPTKPTPSVAHDSFAADGTPPSSEYDADWRWTPDGGFDLSTAPVSLTFWFTAAGSSAASGATMQFYLYVDGVEARALTARGPAITPSGIVLQTVDLGDLTAEGNELVIRIDAGFADSAGVHGILYDSTGFPSALTIGPSVIDTTPPGQVTGLLATARDDHSIGLVWTAASDDLGVAGYNVYRGTAPEALSQIGIATPTAFIDTGLDALTTYYYAVSAFDAGGNEGVLSAQASNTTLSGPTPVEPRPVTVVAVVDDGFSPYHYDFVGHQHPWNLDSDATNDFDFTTDPSTYIAGYPGAKAIDISIPQTADTNVASLLAADAAAWAEFEVSTGSGTGVKLHWLPGTKIIGAVRYGASFAGTNSNHGTRSAASAVGNIHGTCPECLVVLVQGLGNNGVTWAASQPWIDVISNSWESCAVSCTVRNGLATGPAPATWRTASEAGKFVVFAAGNGLENAFITPQFGYLNSQKGTDWIVKVGAVDPGAKQSYSGSTKPVDVSSIGSSYPSTGGTTATGMGTHSGTSNAAPVTAGMIAQVLQEARELLEDTTPGPEGAGVIASGAPVACGSAATACALGDGVLTRSELRDLVYHNVVPDTGLTVGSTTWPNSPYNHMYQGHGVVFGLIDGVGPYRAQLEQMVNAATGTNATLPRPAGEAKWFVIDSKCRQHLTGSWNGGYWQGSDPAFNPTVDHLTMAWNAWCSNLPVGWI
ncbi:MAG: S8 family serine peptidase [Euryarchaeota archaeon]|nr:S8 family serine peptidase [Euryarchaeota archaeon]